jgi:hypothetical protein
MVFLNFSKTFKVIPLDSEFGQKLMHYVRKQAEYRGRT